MTPTLRALLRPSVPWPALAALCILLVSLLLAGAALALAAGWWGLRDVLKRPVVETLRRAVV